MKIAMSRGIQIISVIGGREPTPTEQALAQEVGRELAINNIIVACGGLGGVMEAACKGAKEKGGINSRGTLRFSQELLKKRIKTVFQEKNTQVQMAVTFLKFNIF